jgi:hypothetical protein
MTKLPQISASDKFHPIDYTTLEADQVPVWEKIEDETKECSTLGKLFLRHEIVGRHPGLQRVLDFALRGRASVGGSARSRSTLRG